MRHSWRYPARQLQADSSQILRCQLQIFRGRRSRCVSEHVADDLERHTGAQQAHRTRVAKGMGPLSTLGVDSSRSQTSTRHAVEDRSVLERTMRSLDTQEHLSMRLKGAPSPDTATRLRPVRAAMEARSRSRSSSAEHEEHPSSNRYPPTAI